MQPTDELWMCCRQNIKQLANAGAKGLSNVGAMLQRAGRTVKVGLNILEGQCLAWRVKPV